MQLEFIQNEHWMYLSHLHKHAFNLLWYGSVVISMGFQHLHVTIQYMGTRYFRWIYSFKTVISGAGNFKRQCRLRFLNSFCMHGHCPHCSNCDITQSPTTVLVQVNKPVLVCTLLTKRIMQRQFILYLSNLNQHTDDKWTARLKSPCTFSSDM